MSDQQFAEFGRGIFDWMKRRSTHFFDWELSEEICPIAANAGLMEFVVYNPIAHGQIDDADPGDKVWHFLEEKSEFQDLLSNCCNALMKVAFKRSSPNSCCWICAQCGKECQPPKLTPTNDFKMLNSQWPRNEFVFDEAKNMPELPSYKGPGGPCPKCGVTHPGRSPFNGQCMNCGANPPEECVRKNCPGCGLEVIIFRGKSMVCECGQKIYADEGVK